MSDRTGDGLGRFLTETWGTPVAVDRLAAATTGARRDNVLFDARHDGDRLGLVATIIPTTGIQLMDVGDEASMLRLAEAGGVPVPHVHAVCHDPSYVGGPFFVTSRVEGDTIPRQVLRLVEATPGLGPTLGRQIGDALARLHAVDAGGVPDGVPRPAGGSSAAHELARVEALLGELLQPSPPFRLACRWLARNLPAVSPTATVVHSDCRNGNIVVGPDGLRAILDWEGSHLGDPMEDVAWMCVRMWRFRNDRLEAGGFATRADLAAGYRDAGGTWDGDAFAWWKVLGTVRWGLGLAGQARAHLDGSFRSIVMAASGRRVAELEYDALMLLRGAYGAAAEAPWRAAPEARTY